MGEFSSPCLWSTFCTDYYFGISSTLVLLLQKHIKDPSHSAKNAGGRLQLNTDMHSNFQALVDIKKCSIKRKSLKKRIQSLIQNHMKHERSESAQE